MSDDTINIAFKSIGSLGNLLVHLNFARRFQEVLDDNKIRLYFFGHNSHDINDALIKRQRFIYRYFNRTDWNDQKEYDVIIEIDFFPAVIHMKKANIDKFSKLNLILDKWYQFQSNEATKRFFTEKNRQTYNILYYAILNERNYINICDISGTLGIGKDYELDIPSSGNEINDLSRLGLNCNRYVTIHRGVNAASGNKDAPGIWSVSNYSKLVKLLKEKYPFLKIVQIGKSADPFGKIAEADMDLRGQINADILISVLKNASFHIDGSGSLVHLRKVLTNKPSIVLFGPEPMEFFGYSTDINFQASACNHWCAGLTEYWQNWCIKGINSECINSINPQHVMDQINI